MRRSTIRIFANLAMILTAIIWGLSFVGQDLAMKTMQPMEFTASRFLLGAVFLTPFLFKKNSEFINCIKPGLFLGICLALGAGLQQQALLYTSVGNTAFITGLYAIFVPLLGIIVGRSPNKLTFFSCIIAVIGLYLISIKGEFIIRLGDALVVGCALAFAVQVLLVDHFAKRFPPVSLAIVQFYFCALFCLGYSLIFETPNISNIAPTLPAILFTGLLSVGIAYTLQVIVQKYVNPTHAALILSMETVVGWAAGIFILHEGVTLRTIIGCVLMLAAMIICIVANSEIEQ